MRKSGLLVLVCFLIVTHTSPVPAQNQSLRLKPGDAAPDLKLTKLLQAEEAAKTDWQSLRGKVVLIDFWATWCAPCIASMPYLHTLLGKFKDQPVQFISVTDEDELRVNSFLRRGLVKNWVGLDSEGAVFNAYGITTRPKIFLVGMDGKIAFITEKAQTITEETIKELLQRQSPESKTDTSVPKKAPETVQKESAPSVFSLNISPSQIETSSFSRRKDRVRARGSTLKGIISLFYNIPKSRIFGPSLLEDKKFDVSAQMAEGGNLQQMEPLVIKALEASFGLVVRREVREIDVFVLTSTDQTAQKLRPNLSNTGIAGDDKGVLTGKAVPISALTDALEDKLKIPVIDETNLKGSFDYLIIFDETTPTSLLDELRKETGLQLTQRKKTVEVLIVEKK